MPKFCFYGHLGKGQWPHPRHKQQRCDNQLRRKQISQTTVECAWTGGGGKGCKRLSSWGVAHSWGPDREPGRLQHHQKSPAEDVLSKDSETSQASLGKSHRLLAWNNWERANVPLCCRFLFPLDLLDVYMMMSVGVMLLIWACCVNIFISLNVLDPRVALQERFLLLTVCPILRYIILSFVFVVFVNNKWVQFLSLRFDPNP